MPGTSTWLEGARLSSCSSRYAIDSRSRSAAGLVTFTRASSKWQPRITALPHVVDCDGEEIEEAQHGGLGKLVRLRAKALPCLLGDRQRIGNLAHVVDEQQVPQVLEQLGHEPPEILALLGELLDEGERTRRVAVDDEVAEPEERLLLDRSEQLHDRLHRDLALGRRGQLVERRDGVAEAAASRAGDEGERRLGRLDAFALCDPLQQADELR